MTGAWFARFRGLATGLAAGACVSIVLLTWFSYRAIREWQQSSVLLLQRRADESADLLVLALRRDMRAVQSSVLSVADWYSFMLDPPYDVSTVVASAFARYPYPDSFFAWRGASGDIKLLFFNRSSRRPAWAPREDGRSHYPVTVLADPAVAEPVVARLRADAANRRAFSISTLSLAGVEYQVIAKLVYRDQFREQLEGVFGLIVDTSWVRRHYFQEIATQVARMSGTSSGLVLTVVDGQGQTIAASGPTTGATPISRRPFAMMFFDPLLAAPDPSQPELDIPLAVEVVVAAGSPITASISVAKRTLLLAAAAVIALGLGLVLTARAARASATLAQMRSELVSTITHELKTPIASIRAMGETLVSGRISGGAGLRDYAQLLVQEAKRLTRLVDNLLAYARITDVTEAYSPEPIHIPGLVNDVRQEFSNQLIASGFDLRVSLDPDLPVIVADRTAMRLLLNNLVDNAIRYSGNSRLVEISGERRANTVIISVSDHGVGIPDDEIRHVVRRFVRGKRAASSGSGLGLAIVSRIAADHAGSVAITSTVGVGTTVAVTWPATRAFS